MVKKKVIDRNNPKSLTSEQRMFVDQLVARFGDRYTNVKRKEIRIAAQEILNLVVEPSWITCNKKVRNKEKRGMYNLSALLKLPVVAFKEDGRKKKSKKLKTKGEVDASVSETFSE
jgi:hypothetical protein